MSIVEFSYTDHDDGWQIKPIKFNPGLNLLVGISGAGKSHTLAAIEMICSAALHEEEILANCDWSVSVRWGDKNLCWSASTGAEPSFGYEGDSALLTRQYESVFERETISIDGSIVVARDEHGVRAFGDQIPVLTGTQSIVGLFRQDIRIAPLALALASVRSTYEKDLRRLVKKGGLAAVLARYESRSLTDLIGDHKLPLPLKAYVLQERFTADFEQLVRAPYCDIFPSVTDVRVDRASELVPEDPDSYHRRGVVLDLAIRERAVRPWVTSDVLSEGMFRTLVHILELALSPPGTVLLIDEYENSMGVNCLPAVTEHILRRAGDLQFIITSHHPYVIESIAKEQWMIVRRKGSVVEVAPAREFISLSTSSNQDAFIQLLNAEEYREGVS